MRGQPELLIECDGKGCKAKEAIELRCTARGTYSEDHIDSELRQRGWWVDEAGDLCVDCAREAGLVEDESEDDNAEDVQQ